MKTNHGVVVLTLRKSGAHPSFKNSKAIGSAGSPEKELTIF